MQLVSGVSERAISKVFSILRTFDPMYASIGLPANFRAAKRLVDRGSHFTVYASCPNDCCIFTDDQQQCPQCGASRVGETGANAKTFYHFPVQHRLKWLFGDENLCKLPSLWREAPFMPSGERTHMIDVYDGRLWDFFMIQEAKDPDQLAVMISADGVEISTHPSRSIWVITLQLLNPPSHLRKHDNCFWMLGLVSGQVLFFFRLFIFSFSFSFSFFFLSTAGDVTQTRGGRDATKPS